MAEIKFTPNRIRRVWNDWAHSANHEETQDKANKDILHTVDRTRVLPHIQVP